MTKRESRKQRSNWPAIQRSLLVKVYMTSLSNKYQSPTLHTEHGSALIFIGLLYGL
ncbi:hypothetical protein [Porphyromonas pogonae]|uniref:hypothetical protein n=1 Tax=Porphyromonas pogonae TaxID=867595 RepID=UPI002E785E67|nr:hypothetical protein [Porphyromonas pogonae]